MREFIQKLEAEFEDIPKGTLTPSTKLKDIEGWGSMHALIVLALADTEYNVALKGEELKKAESIQDLFDLIQQKKASK
ncbi:MAG TPA: acyl carrier protein [Bacteroidia bacterium]|jgi:acyl carrier protein|nr:acyl carrier protein [Bacteroidia bacterium]